MFYLEADFNAAAPTVGGARSFLRVRSASSSTADFNFFVPLTGDPNNLVTIDDGVFGLAFLPIVLFNPTNPPEAVKGGQIALLADPDTGSGLNSVAELAAVLEDTSTGDEYYTRVDGEAVSNQAATLVSELSTAMGLMAYTGGAPILQVDNASVQGQPRLEARIEVDFANEFIGGGGSSVLIDAVANDGVGDIAVQVSEDIGPQEFSAAFDDPRVAQGLDGVALFDLTAGLAPGADITDILFVLNNVQGVADKADLLLLFDQTGAGGIRGGLSIIGLDGATIPTRKMRRRSAHRVKELRA